MTVSTVKESRTADRPSLTTVSRLRVAFLALHFAEYALRLAAAMQRRSVDVLLVVYEQNASDELGGRWKERAAQAGVRCLALPRPNSLWQVWPNAKRINLALAAFAPDVIHVQEALRDETVLALAIARHAPMVLTVHDAQPHAGADAANLRWSRRAFYRWYLRRSCQLALTHGQALITALEQATPGLRGRIRSVPHGPLGGPPVPEPVPPAPVRLLFFGRIEAYKGLRYFIEAVVSLRDRSLPVVGVVAGRGDEMQSHRAAMDAAGCFDVRDRYIPADEVAALFNECTAVVLPYVEGTQSGVAAMALGFGRPVIATPVGAIPEMVRPGVNGALIPTRDAAALADAVSALLSRPGEFERLARGALALADGELGWDAIAATTAEVYREAVVQNGRSSRGKSS